MTTSTQRIGADDDLDSFARKHGAAPVTFKVLASALKEIIQALGASARELRGRNQVLEAELRRLESLSVLHERRLAQLEKNSTTARGAQWGGEFESGKSYAAGEFVRYRRSVWVAVRDCASAPGAHLGDWDLVIPGGVQP